MCVDTSTNWGSLFSLFTYGSGVENHPHVFCMNVSCPCEFLYFLSILHQAVLLDEALPKGTPLLITGLGLWAVRDTRNCPCKFYSRLQGSTPSCLPHAHSTCGLESPSAEAFLVHFPAAQGEAVLTQSLNPDQEVQRALVGCRWREWECACSQCCWLTANQGDFLLLRTGPS